MSFSEFTIAMALANAPGTAPPPATIGTLPFDTAIAEIQSIPLANPQRALPASEQLFSALAIATLQSGPAAPSELPPIGTPTTIEAPLPTDPVSPSPSPEPGQSEYTEIIVTPAPKSDPLRALNAESFDVVQGVDDALVGPIALAYEKNLPGPVRSGLSNFLSNLGEPVVFLNYLLQLKPGKALETLGRFTINSTIGIGGLFDVAKKKPFNLPKRENGFANTLGYYGVKPGAFLFLPLIGPTTVRDVIGRVLDLSLVPFAVGRPFNQLAYTLPSGIIVSLDDRVAIDGQIQELKKSSDPYAATRELYLTQRQAEIDALRGKTSETVEPVSGLTSPVQAATPSSAVDSPVGTIAPSVDASSTVVIDEQAGTVVSEQAKSSDPKKVVAPDQ